MGKIHWLTVAGISAVAVVVTVLFHESVHAFFCLVLGGSINHFSAVHVNCSCDMAWQFKIVAASASVANILLAIGIYPYLKKIASRADGYSFFVWLIFLYNLLTGTGYWFASGLTNTGDWAAVIRGFEPHTLYRVGLVGLGTVTLMMAVAWALHTFGRLLDRDGEKPIAKAQALAMVCYLIAFSMMLIAGFAQPGGPFSFPAIAGIIAVLGGYSALLWMMQWFRADIFNVKGNVPLTIKRSPQIILLGFLAVMLVVGITLIGRS